MLIATAYLPSIWYFEIILKVSNVVIDAHEHFVKQSVRNRCHILSPNGIQSLIVPVVHQNRFRLPVKEIRISNDINWQRQHWRSLCAAYRRSAYFEFYQDDLITFYEKKYEFLFEFNRDLMNFLAESINVSTEIQITESYILPDAKNTEDYRSLCNIGSPMSPQKKIKYPQVFGYKDGFVSGLSIVDLMFNMGPASKNYLVDL